MRDGSESLVVVLISLTIGALIGVAIMVNIGLNARIGTDTLTGKMWCRYEGSLYSVEKVVLTDKKP